jgi:threonine dehydratase
VNARRLTLDEVRAARERLRPHLAPTPVRESLAAPGTRLKLECFQPTGSFKVRGALNRIAALDAGERGRGIVAASAGNHALGVAFAVSRLGPLDATVFVPHSAPLAKRRKLGLFPVRVAVEGADYDAAAAAAHAFERETGALYVHAFDDAFTAAGQGTVALELLEQVPDLDAVVVPVGGGGLISGIAAALDALAPQVRVIAVQPEASPALRASLEQGAPLLEYPAGPTLCDGLAGGIGHWVWQHRDLIDEVIEVPEAETRAAIAELLAADQVLAEASGAIAVAALRSGRVKAARPVAVITGANLDVAALRDVLTERG